MQTIIKLIGTNHLGERSYYRKIRQILHECTLVLHENLPLETRDDLQEDLIEYRASMSKSPLTEAFLSAISAYFMATNLYFSNTMTRESAAFQNEISHRSWLRITSIAWEDSERHLIEKCSQLSRDRKTEVLNYVKQALEVIEKRLYTREEYAHAFVFFWADESMRSIFDGILTNNACMQILNIHLEKQTRGCIGIKFGAAHISKLRNSLEAKGFVHRKSIKLCCVAYS
ncbi:MAG: hypothetical protein G01um101448_688 [Parcubacteria group bacterium Gr01-1014_48]|nr:MAG: hypothetical protein Greene041614_442 [Parcubacteria group bacterium Greene0416_14]TSC73602.1 MAG: hypothetical protein G01um101448_688 [Parcubacteria group bacterium Gr01-1014_48]TSD00976.1 MAG: hypothetical protein Greene101415_549 [Parcubacteria group bacterium Greene1014_15]TSD07534.1 MAG: hypothetical protein Greene07144_850 [Parcubacteria group bacterium Greene0714_4]